MPERRLLKPARPLAAISLCALAGCFWHEVSIAEITCEQLETEVLGISDDNRATAGVAILELREPRELHRTEDRVDCEASASMSNGSTTTVRYSAFMTTEGMTLEYRTAALPGF